MNDVDPELEEKIEEIQSRRNQDSGNLIERLRLKAYAKKPLNYFKQSNGCLTKEGAYIDSGEWHALTLGIAPTGTGFLMPSPLGELFIVAELMMLRTGFNKKMRGEEVNGHLGDVMDEIAYTFSGTFLTTALFTYFDVGGLTTLDLSQVILAMLGGA